MKLKEQVQEIVDKYYLGVDIPDEYPTVYKYRDEHPDKFEEEFCSSEITDDTLCEKYAKHIPDGWYGFSIGQPTPPNWFKVIDKVVALMVDNDPDFEIHQIKMKFGGICFYVESNVIEDIWEAATVVEKNLHSKKLIY